MMIHFHVITFGQMMTKMSKQKQNLHNVVSNLDREKEKVFFLDIDPPSNNQYETKKNIEKIFVSK